MSDFVPIIHEHAGAHRRFIIVGHQAKASPAFKLDSLVESGGRMDILVRCIRAGLLYAEGVRRNTTLDLLMLGGESAPLTLRIDGSTVRFLRPDERRNARSVQKALSVERRGTGFEYVAPGMLVGPLHLEALVQDLGGARLFVLAREGLDLRAAPLDGADTVFVIGDNRGLTDDEHALLERRGALRVGLGPVEIHADDALAVVHNELDRRG
jgi:tRNA (pseudouridine54-N1)-methyltransferase